MIGNATRTRPRRVLGAVAPLALALLSAAGAADGGRRKALEDAFGYLEAEDRSVPRGAPSTGGERREEARHASREDASEIARTPEPRPRRD